MTGHSTLAAVDLGSNSFHLQVARIVGDQIYPLDSLREPVRIGAGLTPDKRLDEPAQLRALNALRQFGERLRGMPTEAVRAVGTNTLRVAKNAREFLVKAQAALGFPIEVVAGREEARLIYLGVAHGLPPSRERRLVVDIGGGSTECIIGSGLAPLKLESLYMGCVSYSLRHFSDGKLNKANFRQAETAAGTELQTIRKAFRYGEWQHAVGSSGTARAIGELLEFNGYTDNGITRDGLEQLKAQMIRIGSLDRLDAFALAGLRADRVPVLPGGLAIMTTAFDALEIPYMTLASGAMRQGILYDMLGRFHHHDMRDLTASQFMHRYHVDGAQAKRVGTLAHALLHELLADLDGEAASAGQLLDWAAKLHEIGISVAHSGYHKHTSYIIRNADMPGFSRSEQSRLATLTLAHRGSLDKMQGMLEAQTDIALTLALRLSAMFHRSRTDVALPAIEARLVQNQCRLKLEPNWLAENPLTAVLLRDEIAQWRKVGITLDVRPMQELEAMA
ncbi:MAG: Ppx/GppA family phosphatase [Proteobacteria bacterium]|nr:Ppx/GppA family phosphatase [Burkholderiales bacterium]